MTGFKYSIELTIAARGRSQTDVMERVERARMQAGAKEPTFGGWTASDDNTGTERAIVASIEVMASDDDELARTLRTMSEWLEDQEQAPVLSGRVTARSEATPLTIEGRGLHFDAETGSLTILPEAERMELLLMGPHEAEPGIIAVVVTGDSWGRKEQALVVRRVVFEGSDEAQAKAIFD